MKEVYQSNEDAGVVGDALEDMAREVAWRLLAAALEEVNGFLGRERCERSDEFRGYRSDYHSNGGSLEDARAIAAHESSPIMRLYDRSGDRITLDEIERIRF